MISKRRMGMILVFATGALVPASAHALTYDNTDPASGCSASGYTLTSAPVDSKNSPTVAGTIELRWSRSCNTGWARFTPASGVQPITATVTTRRPADGAQTDANAPRYSTNWPLYANQLNGSANCIVASVSLTWDGPNGGVTAVGATGCAGGAAPSGSTAETTGGATSTWSNYATGGGTAGAPIGSNATVSVACRVQGLAVADGNRWWYRVASSPWSGTFYASADAFYNNGQTSGSLAGTPFVDMNVSTC